MNAFSSEVIDRLGWVLIHSLWQFAIAAIVAALIVSALRRRSATSRYTVLVVAMFMMVVAPCATWIVFPASDWASALRVDAVNTDLDATVLLDTSTNNSVMPTPLEAHAEVGATMPELQPALEFGAVDQTRRADAQPLAEVAWIELVRPWFSWIVGCWLIGVLLCSLRPLLGWRMLRRLRRIGISSPSDEILAVFARVSQRLDLRRSVQIFHSTLAAGPLVVGYLKPIVLIPVSLVSSIPLSQLEAILAHELAHIRRHDFIINLAQTLMETLFFYHPAIWWLSRRIRIEREHCCDDLVVKLFNNGIDYGRALMAIEQLQSQRTILALGAADGSLLGRIRRISGATSHQPRFFPCLAMAIALSVICGMWLASQELIYGASGDIDDLKETEADTPVVATVMDNLTVELLGVGLHPSQGRDWWRPDGGKLKQQPDLKNFGRFSVGMDAESQTHCREFMIEIRGLSKDHAVRTSYGPVSASTSSAYVNGLWMGHHGAGPFESSTTAIRVGLTTEPYGPAMKIDMQGKKNSNIEIDEDLTPFYDRVQPLSVNEVDSVTTLLLNYAPYNELDDLADWDLYAVDAAGIHHHRFSEEVPLTRPVKTQSLRFRLPIKDIVRFEYCIRPYRHWVKFGDVSLEQGKKTDVKVSVESVPKPQPIQAQLPNGELIKLLGISKPPTELLPSKDKREWWKADGTTMDAAPIPRDSIHVDASKIDGREFVVRASNFAGQFPMDVTLKERFKEGQPYKPEGNGWSQSSTQSGPIYVDQKDKWQVTSEYVAGPVGDADSATLEVRVGSSVAAEMLFDVKGQRLNGDSKDDVWQLAAVRKMAERVEVLRTGPHEAGFAIWTKPFSSTTDEGILHVALIDTSGQRHNPFTSGSDGTEAYHAFEFKPEEIDQFVVLLQPYQYVATFENVSLKPGVKSDVKVAVTSLTAEKPPVAAASESAKEPTDAAESASVAHYTGTVNDDKGQPLAGARIYILPFASGKKDPGPVRATTDEHGRFEFDAMDMTYPRYDGTPELHDGLLIATKDGYGPDSFHTWGNRNDGLRDWTTPIKGAPIELQLASDDVPVRGRLLDPEGKSLAGANVKVEAIGLPIKFNLDTHLKTEAEAEIDRGFLIGAKVYERSLGRPELVPGAITHLQTDAEGNFEIAGVGHERLVTLSVRHPSIQDARIIAMSRVAPDVGTIRDWQGNTTSTIHGSGFTRQMSPSLTVKGVVRDRRTKAPISGMWVTKFGDPIRYAYYNQNPAITDENGRFTITGLDPVYGTLPDDKRDIAAYPQPGIPYLMSQAFFTVNEDTIIECERGIPFRLKVVDEAGNAVEGGVFYRPITPNPAVEELVTPLRGNSFDAHSMRAIRRDDGIYEGFVLPGPGAIVFDASQRHSYQPAMVDPKAFFEPKRTDWPTNSNAVYGTQDTLATVFQDNDPQTRHEGIVLVNPPSDSEPLELTVTVIKDRPRQVSLIDSDGKPVTGVDSKMRWPDRETQEILNSARFMLKGLHPSRVKQMTFNHKERNLTGVLLARGDTDEPITVVMQSPATVIGRLVLPDDKPMKNPYLAMRAVDEGADVLRLGKPEPDGRFRIEGLIPGLSFASVNSGDVVRFVTLDGHAIENIVLQPGEVRDVGDVKVVSDER